MNDVRMNDALYPHHHSFPGCMAALEVEHFLEAHHTDTDTAKVEAKVEANGVFKDTKIDHNAVFGGITAAEVAVNAALEAV